MNTHIQHHNHTQNSNTLADELREELFGDMVFEDFVLICYLAMGFSTLASLGIYLAVFYLF